MLHAERLTCIVDDRPLFAALTLSLAAGELLQVAGDNGAGKTSLLRILCGLARPESGVVSWQGQPLAKVRESFHRQLLWLGHKPGVNAALTADENLRFFFPASRLQQRKAPSLPSARRAMKISPEPALRRAAASGGAHPPVVNRRAAVDPR